MENKHGSSSKALKTSPNAKSTSEREFSPKGIFKRRMEVDSDIKNPLKIRKVIPEAAQDSYNNTIDAIFDSDDDFDSVETCIISPGNKENSPKKNKGQATLTDVCEPERSKHGHKSNKTDNKSIQNSEKNEHFIDASLMSEIFSSFSDSEDESKNSAQISVLNGKSDLKKNGKIIEEETVESNFSEDIDDLFKDHWDETEKVLDFTDFTRVNIIDISTKRNCIHVTVEDPEPDSNATALVMLSGNWMESQIAVGESLIVKAKKSFGDWVVNNEWGFVITHPDILVSGTSVANSMFCQRKSVLQTRFASINVLPNLKPNDSAMTCGSIVHEILQKALKDQLYSIEQINAIFEKVMRLPQNIQLMYASDLTYNDTKQLVQIYLTKIHEFIERYLNGTPPAVPDKMFQGQITNILDIEENVWLPQLGLKGKIDVTVEVRVNKLFNTKKIMPLEIKTGRTVFSPEHRGQLYLYVMMLKLLGYDVDSGLLLYIKDNQMQEIKSTIHDQRGLIAMRNTMAHYLSKPSVTVTNTGSFYGTKTWEPCELPEPINHANYCKNCPYSSLCCVFAAADPKLNLNDRHPITQLTTSLFQDLETQHADYVMHWVAMLEKEDVSIQEESIMNNVWSTKPEVREHRKIGIAALKVHRVTKIEDHYHHEFVRISEETGQKYQVKDFREVFGDNDYVTISSPIRWHVCSGHVMHVSKAALILNLDRDLTRYKKDEVYSVDQYGMKSPLFKILGNIATLLAPNDITRRLRKIIIDREPARFEEEIPKALHSPEAKKILSRLNKYQQQALMAVIKANDYVLIKGMPGTGKTETLVALIELLNLLGKSVIVSAHTHNAVDNILLKLNEKNVDFMRLGGAYRMHPELLHKSEATLTQGCDDPEKLKLIYEKHNVVGVTCLGAGHVLLSKKIFDYCLVDECTQVLQPVLLRPLYSAHKFVFVGDPEQLPAVVKNSEARKQGMTEDIFSRLDSSNNTRVLKYQYRMNEVIMDLANKFTYKGELLVGNETIGKATVKLSHPERLNSYEKWVQRTLSTDLRDSIVVLNTGETGRLRLHSGLMNNQKPQKEIDELSCRYTNWYEIGVIQKLVKALISSGVNAEDIGIIAPFRVQIHLLKTVIKEDVEINTVDQYQGRDKSVILFSCTRSNRAIFEPKNTTEYRILEDPKRINVAVTRAKHKIIIIGDVSLLLEYGEPTNKLFTILKDSVVDLKPGVDGFEWEGLIDELVKIKEAD